MYVVQAARVMRGVFTCLNSPVLPSISPVSHTSRGGGVKGSHTAQKGCLRKVGGVLILCPSESVPLEVLSDHHEDRAVDLDEQDEEEDEEEWIPVDIQTVCFASISF